MLQLKDTEQLNGLKKKTQDPYICCLQETHFRSKDIHRVREQKNTFHENGNEKKAGVTILTPDKTDF